MELRRWGVAMALALGLVAFLLSGWPPLAAVVGLGGVVVLGMAVAAPDRLEPVKTFFEYVTTPVRIVVGGTAMALVFFGLVTPMGVVLRMLGRVGFGKMEPGGDRTYWVDRSTEPEDPERALRQF